MIIDLPPLVPEMPSPAAEQLFLSITSLARHGALSRDVVLGQLARGELKPDAYMVFGSSRQPLFFQHRAIDLVRNANLPKSRAS